MAIDRSRICDDIEIMDEGTTVVAYNEKDQKVFVPYGDLEWRNPYENGDCSDLPLFLTLKEIEEQLFAKNYKTPFFVAFELGLSGKIYQYSESYDDSYTPHWVEYGETIGYA